MDLSEKKIIFIVGPTAVGKTAFSIELAKKYNGEIINGDSVQVYKGLDIGSAKITTEQMQGIKHHLIDIKNPEEEYTVKDFQKDCRNAIDKINKKGKVAIVVGGSGLYINSVIYKYEFKEYEEKDKKFENYTHEQLKEIYFAKYEKDNNSVDIQNYIRLKNYIYKRENNVDLSNNAQEKYYKDYVILSLNIKRDQLYDRINRRVEKMFDEGLIEEVKQFKATYPSQTAIGYKEVHSYLHGEITKEEAINLVQRNTRRFAKRQITWTKNKMSEAVQIELEGEVWKI